MDTGIFSKMNADNLNALIANTENTSVAKPEQEDEEIDFNGLDDYAAKVEEQKVNATPNGNVEQGPS